MTFARSLIFTAGMAALLGASVPAQASVLTFEGVAPAGNVLNVSPTTPYTESGFTLTPDNGLSAVFDAADPTRLLGDTTSYFGFAGRNVITLTGAGPFDLDSFIFGQLTIATAFIDLTVVGNVSGGGILTHTYSGFATSTLETLNWTDLASVTFTTNDAAGLDDITVNAASSVPEPLTLSLFGAGIAGAAALRRRANRRS